MARDATALRVEPGEIGLQQRQIAPEILVAAFALGADIQPCSLGAEGLIRSTMLLTWPNQKDADRASMRPSFALLSTMVQPIRLTVSKLRQNALSGVMKAESGLVSLG